MQREQSEAMIMKRNGKGLPKKALSDLKKYNRMMVNGDASGCLAIEEEWGLDGFPPSIVTKVLREISEGEPIARVMERLD